tara:strand:- start:800 stop:1285 length:486 start_codon:yes stop_codon:yes gene_type:complete
MAAAAIPYVMAAVSAASAVAQGVAQQDMLEAQQAGFEDEKEYLAQQREFLNEARDEELELFQEQTRELLGVQEVSFAKAGVEMSGSALKVLRETAQDAFDEESRIMRQYARYRTMSEMKSDSINRQKQAISNQQSALPAMTSVSALASGATGWYQGAMMIK